MYQSIAFGLVLDVGKAGSTESFESEFLKAIEDD
jgi:hypothetical protein